MDADIAAGLTVVATYCPSGETRDMKPIRMFPFSLPSGELH